jgi:hypothetical protein
MEEKYVWDGQSLPNKLRHTQQNPKHECFSTVVIAEVSCDLND